MRYQTLAALLLACGLCGAQEAVFDPDPEHPWNRLQRELYTRITLDGEPYFGDGVDAQLVSRSRFSADGPSYLTVIEALDEFLKAKGEGLVRDPLKRALLQRDLWAMFTATASHAPQPRELHERLVKVMRRIALSPEEIDALPDNLSQAVESKSFPRAFDAERPDAAFLPADLMHPAGSWVLVANRLRDDRLAAPIHVNATDGRAAFLLFLRLPEGRQATEAYLVRLERLQIGTDEITQFPAGTQVALLRRTMLIDDAGELRLSPLTETLQIRVYRRIETPDLFEFTMDRGALIAGRVGLRPTRPHLVSDAGLRAAGIGLGKRAPSDPPRAVASCVVCHAGPGIFGFQSMHAGHPERPPLTPARLEDQVKSAIEQTRRTDAWRLLSGIWRAELSR